MEVERDGAAEQGADHAVADAGEGAAASASAEEVTPPYTLTGEEVSAIVDSTDTAP
jgi:hypothetical protein